MIPGIHEAKLMEGNEMNANQAHQISRTARTGWGLLIAVSLLLLLHGAIWVIEGPGTALENIAERTDLAISGFEIGSPSASDVIALTARNFAIVEAALGLMALIVAVTGFRTASALAWTATAVLVVGLSAMAVNFVLVGGLSGGSVGYLGIALLAVLGQFLARPR